MTPINGATTSSMNFYGSQIYNEEVQQKSTVATEDLSGDYDQDHQQRTTAPPTQDEYRINLKEEIRNFPSVWDVRARGFKNNEYKRQSWKKIGEKLQIDGVCVLFLAINIKYLAS